MNTKKAPRIGILVEITREFGRGLCRGISEFALKSGAFSPYLISASDLGNAESLRTYDGFIARVMNDRIANALAATHRPVVDVYYDKLHKGFAIVKTRHSRIGTIAAEHFLARRFKNFAFCGFAGGRFSDYCRAAFAHSLAKRSIKCHTYEPNHRVRYDFNSQVLINERLQVAPDAKDILRWLKKLPKPVGVFCPNDLRAWQLLQICNQKGINVPREVAILGLDNDVLICGLANPMTSSIDPDTEAIGRCAAETLLEMIKNPSLADKGLVRQVDPVGVVERTSTEVYPIEPDWLSDALVFINKNISRNLTASDVYRETGLSHTQVDKMFRAKLGTSVQKEIAAMRLEHAKHLVETTRLPILEVAQMCGFSSSQYLIRTFTKKFGTPPAIWRSQSRAEANRISEHVA